MNEGIMRIILKLVILLALTSMVFAGTYEPVANLYRPIKTETGYETRISDNFDKIAELLGTGPGIVNLPSLSVSGQLVYVSGADTMSLAKADAASTAKVHGWIWDKSSDTTGRFSSSAKNNHFTGLTPGSFYWLSANVAGAVTATKPVWPNYSVPIGVAVNSTTIQGAFFSLPDTRDPIDVASGDYVVTIPTGKKFRVVEESGDERQVIDGTTFMVKNTDGSVEASFGTTGLVMASGDAIKVDLISNAAGTGPFEATLGMTVAPGKTVSSDLLDHISLRGDLVVESDTGFAGAAGTYMWSDGSRPRGTSLDYKVFNSAGIGVSQTFGTSTDLIVIGAMKSQSVKTDGISDRLGSGAFTATFGMTAAPGTVIAADTYSGNTGSDVKIYAPAGKLLNLMAPGGAGTKLYIDSSGNVIVTPTVSMNVASGNLVVSTGNIQGDTIRNAAGTGPVSLSLGATIPIGNALSTYEVSSPGALAVNPTTDFTGTIGAGGFWYVRDSSVGGSDIRQLFTDDVDMTIRDASGVTQVNFQGAGDTFIGNATSDVYFSGDATVSFPNVLNTTYLSSVGDLNITPVSSLRMTPGLDTISTVPTGRFWYIKDDAAAGDDIRFIHIGDNNTIVRDAAGADLAQFIGASGTTVLGVGARPTVLSGSLSVAGTSTHTEGITVPVNATPIVPGAGFVTLYAESPSQDVIAMWSTGITGAWNLTPRP